MTIWLRQLFKQEKGQALAEYQVLMPGSILMVLAAFVLIANPLERMYCEVVSMFDPDACSTEVVTTEDPGSEEDQGNDEKEPNGCQIHNRSQGGSQCDASPACTLTDVGINHGTILNHNPNPLLSFIIKAGQEYITFYPGVTNDGCYLVDLALDGYSVTWSKIGGGNNCKDVSHLEQWRVRLCNPNDMSENGGIEGN